MKYPSPPPTMDIRPFHDRLVVRRLDAGERNIGGIVVPDAATEKPPRGKVIYADFGKVNADGPRVPGDVKAGELISFGTRTRRL